MGRYLGPKCKICRRVDMKLFLKGVRCITEKCAFAKRPKPPGSSPVIKQKMTDYGIRLREKQKFKRTYGILERQFRRFFEMASRSKEVTGRKLIELLECRLDNVVFRSLFASSREQARQMVGHGFIFVDGKRVNIPSYIVRENQTIELRANDSVLRQVKQTIEQNSKERSVPVWMRVDNAKYSVTIVRAPQKEDLNIAVDEQLVVELYSK